jgi:anti-sigma factor RsiW
MACQELVEVITEYIEGTLPAADRVRFEAHLQVCPHCNRYLDQFRTTIEQAGRIRADELPEELTGQLLEAFHSWRR